MEAKHLKRREAPTPPEALKSTLGTVLCLKKSRGFGGWPPITNALNPFCSFGIKFSKFWAFLRIEEVKRPNVLIINIGYINTTNVEHQHSVLLTINFFFDLLMFKITYVVFLHQN